MTGGTLDRDEPCTGRPQPIAYAPEGTPDGAEPPPTPHLKGTVKGLNRAVESMFLAALPGYARQPRPGQTPFPPQGRGTARLRGVHHPAAGLDVVNLVRAPDCGTYQFLFHVHGLAGVGKSTLIRRWETVAREKGAVTAIVGKEV
ncbi:MAG TPA: hypothetical protein VIU15_13290 [Streptomyces sp.]